MEDTSFGTSFVCLTLAVLQLDLKTRMREEKKREGNYKVKTGDRNEQVPLGSSMRRDVF